MLATTLGALIERVRRDQLLVSRGQMYTLAAPGHTLGATTIILNETPTHISQGSVLSIDHEQFYVQSMNPSTKTATVIPGYFGTTQAAHATNAIIEVDTPIPRCSLADFAEQEIRSWGNQLFRVETLDVDYLSGNRTADLGVTPGTRIFFLLDVRGRPAGQATSYWHWSWTDDAWPHVDARLMRDPDPVLYPSGYSLQLLRPSQRSTNVRVAYATDFLFPSFDDSTDLVADVGLQDSWIEVVELGVKERAYNAKISGRTDFRVGTMSQEYEGHSVFDLMRAKDQVRSDKGLRFTDAAMVLRADWPYRN